MTEPPLRAGRGRPPPGAAPGLFRKSALAGLLAAGFWALTPRRVQRRLSILMYHRVLAEPDPFFDTEILAADFRWQMAALGAYFSPLSLAEAVERLQGGDLPPRAVCVTFDDGYRDNYEVALPVLEDLGIPATFFVSSGYVNGGIMWNDVVREYVRHAGNGRVDLRPAGLPLLETATIDQQQAAIREVTGRLKQASLEERECCVAFMRERAGLRSSDLMMTDAMLRDAAARGVELGAHTVSHPILRKLPDAAAAAEIRGAKEALEGITGGVVRYFAYPNGVPAEDYEERHVRMVREAGFEAALSTRWGTAGRCSDRWQLPRFTPWERRDPARFVFQMLRNYRLAV